MKYKERLREVRLCIKPSILAGVPIGIAVDLANDLRFHRSLFDSLVVGVVAGAITGLVLGVVSGVWFVLFRPIIPTKSMGSKLVIYAVSVWVLCTIVFYQYDLARGSWPISSAINLFADLGWAGLFFCFRGR